ncbi:MAG TPA: hypothetical protein VE954_38515 [Oligoflexus sp.]|uniref:hypothetical protein n=1 Tax=Oligoflexus sp. TaxID=1971216 RepID=UPI002D3A99B8|nr:hypothetical protein [Oligoflexus sp.]HYX39035.1 hypothetical protein [Oligoflexus sp.]
MTKQLVCWLPTRWVLGATKTLVSVTAIQAGERFGYEQIGPFSAIKARQGKCFKLSLPQVSATFILGQLLCFFGLRGDFSEPARY